MIFRTWKYYQNKLSKIFYSRAVKQQKAQQQQQQQQRAAAAQDMQTIHTLNEGMYMTGKNKGPHRVRQPLTRLPLLAGIQEGERFNKERRRICYKTKQWHRNQLSIHCCMFAGVLFRHTQTCSFLKVFSKQYSGATSGKKHHRKEQLF